LTLYDSFLLINKLEEKINVIPGPNVAKLNAKLNDFFLKNKGLKVERKNLLYLFV